MREKIEKKRFKDNFHSAEANVIDFTLIYADFLYLTNSPFLMHIKELSSRMIAIPPKLETLSINVLRDAGIGLVD